jgi:hypothetical protein
MTESRKMSEREMVDLWYAAKKAGEAAADAARPTPMVVSEAGLDDRPVPGGKSWYVPEGVCGFAWVNVKPGTSRFAKMLVRTGEARRDSYYGGVTKWVGGYGQSYDRKCAYARAMAKVLSDAGVTAYAMDRLD